MLSLAAGFQKLHFNIRICCWHFCLTPTTKKYFSRDPAQRYTSLFYSPIFFSRIFPWPTVQTDAWNRIFSKKQNKKNLSQEIVLRIELNLLLKSDRFKYLRHDKGNKKGKKTVFVIFYSRLISVDLYVQASGLRNYRHIINNQLMESNNVATGPCDACERLWLLN